LLFLVLIALPALVTAKKPTSSFVGNYPNSAQQPAFSTGLDGYLRDANTGEGLAGYVYVYDASDPSVQEWAFADSTGYYTTGLPAGAYDVYGTMIGYHRVDESIAIADGETARLDFDLPAPIMDWAPQSISETIPPNEVHGITLVISNTGTGDLRYRIDEITPDADFPTSLPPTTRAAGVAPQVYADLAASPDGTTEILVVMGEQADLNPAYSISDWSARGHFVYHTLKAAAQRSQAGIREYLDSRGVPYHSHISLNSLTLAASRSIVDTLAVMPEVHAIQPGYVYNIPRPILESGIDAPGAIPWNIANVAADQVWANFGVTGQGIVVANIDTGVEWDHVALKNQYRGWDGAMVDHDYNWWDPRGICSPSDEPCDNFWHGTHVMGTMIGSDLPGDPLNAPNAIGLAPGAKWIACKGCEMADGWPCSTFALLECADFLLAPWDQSRQNPNPDLRPHVINNSWAGEANDGWYFDVVASWRAAGMFPAFSAGNDGPSCGTVNSPGDYYTAFTTGAVDQYDAITSKSSRGPSQLGLTKPDVTAPGLHVYSSFPPQTYTSASGTSMASPHTAGEVALVWSAQPDLIGQVQVTEQLIKQTADPITTTEECGGPGSDVPNNTYGWGRSNAHEAVSTALSYEWDIDWLAVSPPTGSVPSGDLVSIQVTLDATNLTSLQCYTATLKLETNDPYQGLDVFVPVTLCTSPERYYLPIVVHNETH
jgi:subtilisin family serine protease